MVTKYDKAIAGAIAALIGGIVGAIINFSVVSGWMTPEQGEALGFFTTPEFAVGLTILLVAGAVYFVPNKTQQKRQEQPESTKPVS